MAIGDHAISDRAISAPADVVIVGVTFPGRCVARDRPAGEAQAIDGLATMAWAGDGAAGSNSTTDAPAGRAQAFDGFAGSVQADSFPI